MSRSSESFTLLESGTSRIHFKLAKELEEASSPQEQDQITLETIATVRKQLSSRSFSADVSKLSSALVTLLHCCLHYPSSAASLSAPPTSIDASFALLPTLQLLGLATKWKHILVAYQLLPYLLPKNNEQAGTKKEHEDSVSTFPVAHSPIDDSSSLLLLNTFRTDLSAALGQAQQQYLHRDTGSRSRSPLRSRSTSRPAPSSKDDLPQDDSLHRINLRAMASLKSLVTGTPRGSAVLPSLASILVELTRHPDSSIRSVTLNAMLSCAAAPAGHPSDGDGQREMLDAALTIARLILASTYAFTPGSNLDENQGMILAEMDRRVDTSPNVLRACIRIVDHARGAGLITSQEAACHALEVLQASRWAPMHLEILPLQQQRVASDVTARTEGLRARTAARQKASLQTEHVYHGTYAPWLVDACLSSLNAAVTVMLKSSSSPLDEAVKREVLKMVLRIYHVASQGKAAALALCLSAARCIGALHAAPSPASGTSASPPSDAAGDTDGELAALWATLSAHVKSQLHSTNPNRKSTGIMLLDALLPLGWAESTQPPPGEEPAAEPTSPVRITEAEMGQLMAMLADPDTSIRQRVLALLHRVDPGLAVQLRSQLQTADDDASRDSRGSTDTLRSSRHNSKSTRRKTATRSIDSIENLQASAIPSESKRLRDRDIAKAMSDSIAHLVLGSDAQAPSSNNEVIFSATSSGILEDGELDLVEEEADPERRLDAATVEGLAPSLLDLVHQCHNHEPWLDTSLTPFVLDGVQIGFLPAKVVKACVDDSAEQLRAGSPPVLRKVRFAMKHREILSPIASSRVCEAITFTKDFATGEERTAGLNAVAQRWRQARIFPDPLDGWRDELYAIYGLNPRPGSRNPIAFKLERAACALFGFATFGVHLTAYTLAPTGELKVWVPQRSSTKTTWPGYLDNSVAGGIVAGDLPMESMVRECEEEANLESSLVEKHIKQTGVLSYCYKTAKQGWIQPEVEYVYDLPLPSDVILQPKDGEVDHFELLTLDEIYGKMREGKFKANCVLVLLDFLIRHGHVKADDEPGYRQIVAQLHVDLRLPGP